MPADKLKRSPHFLLALALSFILPGAGHLTLGDRRGYIFIILVFLLLVMLAVAIIGYGAAEFIAPVLYIYAALIVASVAGVIYLWFSKN